MSPNLRYRFTEHVDVYLKDQYHGGIVHKGEVIDHVVRLTGFPRHVIKKRAQKFGLTGNPCLQSWSEYEVAYLEKWAGKIATATMAEKLRRTETSVAMKLKRLSISSRVTEGYSIHDLTVCLGETHHKIDKWIRSGWLKCDMQGTRRDPNQNGDIHRVNEKHLISFIKSHPNEICLGRVDQTWFLDLVLLGGTWTNPVGSRKVEDV